MLSLMNNFVKTIYSLSRAWFCILFLSWNHLKFKLFEIDMLAQKKV